MHRIVGTGLAACAVLGLAGCVFAIPFNNGPQGPMSARISDGKLEVAVCDSLAIDSIDAQSRLLPGDWEAFWDTEGTTDISAGDILRTDSLPLVGTTTEPELESETEIAVSLGTKDGNVIAVFHGLNSRWTKSDGATSERPC